MHRTLPAVLRIRDILVRIRIRIRGFELLTEPVLAPDPAIFVIGLQDTKKKKKEKFSAYYFLNVRAFTSS
jgi:hypothetical protein